jgi:hypothetical protein
MKTNSLLFLASLAVLAVNARAAQSQPDNQVVILPAYEVSAPRYLAAEKKVKASLDELRHQADGPAVLAAEISAFKNLAAQPNELARAARDVRPLQFAKL